MCLWNVPGVSPGSGHLITWMDTSVGHLNGILARVGGNLNDNFRKSQMPWGLPRGGMLKLRFDRYIRRYVYTHVCQFSSEKKELLENCRCFYFSAAILVHQNCSPIWRLHTKLYKGAWNVSANNSETVGHKDLKLGQIVYILVFYNISFSWLLPLDGFHFICLLRDSENDLCLFLLKWIMTIIACE